MTRRPMTRLHAWLSAHHALLSATAAVVLVALAGLAGCEQSRRVGAAPEDGAQMARADRTLDSLARLAWTDELTHPPRPLLDDAGVIALGYEARAELGIGSPFRLATFALRDPRLPPSLGRAVAWSALSRAARGATYSLGATALPQIPDGPPVARQRTLIDSVVLAAPSARTGEAAVRVAYALAQQERLVGGPTVAAATRLAAQARDRRLAREDATRLLHASAKIAEADALTLLARWREERRLQVEQPLLSHALRPDDASAVRAGIALRDALREAADVAARSGALATAADSATASATAAVAVSTALPVLPSRTARRLAELPTVRGGPPQAPVAVAVAAYRRELLRAGGAAAGTHTERRRFAERVRSEETLAAEVAVASQADSGTALPADLAGVALAAAVGMRAFAQDTVLPLPAEGTPGMGVAGADVLGTLLHARYGLRAVTFDATVPAAWRPYYLAQLAGAIDELQAVLPWVDFDGLAVRVGESVKRDSALALHDPSSRTLYLPAATGAGTIAHELAHDLDWQTARTRLAIRGTYSTDRVMKEGKGALAVSVRGLTAARPRSAGNGPGERPAELFARGVDWFVASQLATSGRMNGALSAVQDEVLAGYAGVVAPDAGDGRADALVSVLADMTVVPTSARRRFLDEFGMDALLSTPAVVRLAAGVPIRGGPERTLRSYQLVGAACVSDEERLPAADWRAELLRASAESRARGMLRDRARWWISPARWSWEARSTLGGPWRPSLADSAVARVRDVVLRAVVWEDAAHHPLAAGPVTALAERASPICR